MVRTVEEIEEEISQLPKEQLKQFRTWYEKFASDAWDEQIEKDAFSEKLDVLSSTAIAGHQAGKSKKI